MAEDNKFTQPKKPTTATTEQVAAFKETVDEASRVLWGNDTERSLRSDSDDIFVLGEDGKFVPNTLESDEELASYAAAGRLFARDERNQLRQFLFVEDMVPGDGAEMGRYLQMTDPVTPPKPPAWWKYVLSIITTAFDAEIENYAQLKTVHDAYVKSDFYEPIEELPDDLLKFEKALNEYSERTQTTSGVILSSNRSKEAIVEAMGNTARRAFAREILNEIEDNPSDRKEILEEYIKTFDATIQELREFLPKTFDPEEMTIAVNKGLSGRDKSGVPVSMKFDFIGETALENFRNYVKAGRTDNFQQRKYLSAEEISAVGKQNATQYCDPLGIPKKNQAEKEVGKETMQIKPWKYQVKDTRDLSADEFLKHLSAVGDADLLTPNKTLDVLNNKACKPEDYFNAVTEQLEAKVARGIVMSASGLTSAAREAFLNEQKELYTAMISGLGDYVFNHTNKDALLTHCKNPQFTNAEFGTLLNASDAFLKTAVDGYTQELNEQNATKAKEAQAEQPGKQVEKELNEPQKQANPLGLK